MPAVITTPVNQYEIPRYGVAASHVHGWCLEALAESEAWLKAQRPALGWESALQMLSAEDGASDASGMSNLGYNKGKRVARELVASLANFRHEGEFTVTWNDQLYDQAHVLTNLDRNWYRTTYANEAHRGALQYAVATGTGYLLETWDKHFWGPLKGDIRLSAISPGDVTFVQLPKDHDIQRAYAVIIREEMPINLARAIYAEDSPAFAASLVPDRDQPGWIQRGLQKVQQFLSPALRVAGRMNKQNEGAFPTVDVFHMYVLDRSVNETGHPIQMGVPGTNWAYTVPSIDDPIATDQVNQSTGNFFTVPATREHARLFPLRRYVIFSRTAIGYDGTSPWWHGEVPLARIRFNDWAWEPLGASLVGETKTMQDGIIALMRGIEDAAAARLDPALAFDEQMVSKEFATAVNPRKAGVRAGAQLSMGEIFRPILPAEYYNVPPWIPDWIRQQEDRIDYMTGVRDLIAIAKAQQVPGADTLEKLMEMAGPIVQDLVRQIEHPLQRLGDWRKAYYFQFYTKPRMLTITGPDGVDFDVKYLPESLMPYVTGETPQQRAQRGRRSIEEFRYKVTESGINEIHRMTNKLLYIQLQKLGFPLSWWTLAKVCQIPQFGPPPKDTNTELERWIAQKRIEIDIAMEQARLAAEAQAVMGMTPAGGGAGGGADGGAGGAGGDAGAGGATGKPEGRPPSMQSAPRLESKDGGTRSTISTSR